MGSAGFERRFITWAGRQRRTPFAQLVQSPFVQASAHIGGDQPHVYEVDYPFNVRGDPFGEVRVAVSTALLLNDIKPRLRRWATLVALALVLSTILAAVVAERHLRRSGIFSRNWSESPPVSTTPRRQPRKRRAGSADELGQVRRKISQVGQQLRGVHEIFSSLRENMNSVMAGLEDGLLLFTRDARAVMVSPAAEKFLGAPASQFLGEAGDGHISARAPAA